MRKKYGKLFLQHLFFIVSCSLFATLFLPQAATAAFITSTWQNGSGAWTDTTHWTPSTAYPSNSVADSYAVSILDTAANPTVSLTSQTITVDSLANYETLALLNSTLNLAQPAGMSNQGTVNVNAYFNTSYTSTVNGGLTNDGTINLTKYGSYLGRGHLTYAGSDLNGTGTINVGDGSRLKLAQDTDLHGNSVNMVNGYFQADSGYTGGTVAGYGYVDGSLGGDITVRNGTMRLEDGSATIASTGQMGVEGILSLGYNNVLDNAGGLTVQNNGQLLMEQATINNTGSGVTTIGAGGTMNVNGYLNTSYTSTVNNGLTNDGTINLTKYGSYLGRGHLTYAGSDLNGTGTISVGDGSRLNLAQDTDLHGNSVNMVNGYFQADSGYTGGTVAGYGYVDGSLGGDITVRNGTMRLEDGSATIASTGQMGVEGILSLGYNNVLDNAGGLTVQNHGQLLMEQATINNTGSGVTKIGAGGTMNVNGYLNTSYTSTVNNGLTNDGTINLTKYGSYTGRGHLTYAGSDLNGTGTINVGDGSRLNLAQDTDLHGNSVNMVNGYFQADSGYTGGTVAGYGYVDGSLGGDITVRNGTMRLEDGSATIASIGQMGVEGILSLGYNNVLDNAGGLTVQNNGQLLMEQATINNTGSGVTTIDAGGTMNVNGYLNTSYTSTVNNGLTNDGTINLTKYGSYLGRGHLTYAGSDLNGTGTINVGDGSRLNLAQDTDLHGNSVNMVNGYFQADSGYTGGTIAGYGYVDGSLGGDITVRNGTMRLEDGSATIASTGQMGVEGILSLGYNNVLDNAGGLTVQNNGQLLMEQATINNTGSGVTTIGAGGTMNVNGYLNTSYTSTVNGGLTNDGTINLTQYGSYLGRGHLTVNGDLLLGTGSRLNIINNAKLTVAGDFVMQIMAEAAFNWASGSELSMVGGVSDAGTLDSWNWDKWVDLEIGGKDQGASTGYSNNFDLEKLSLGGGGHVYLSDWFDNGNRDTTTPFEALYLSTLSIGTGAYLNLNGLNLYVGGSKIIVGSAGKLAYQGGWIIDAAVPHNEPVPEPSTLLLLGSGLAGVAVTRRKKTATSGNPR